MQALVHSVSNVVVALATAAFVHFGVVVKDPHCTLQRPAAIRQLPISAPASATVTAHRPRTGAQGTGVVQT